MTAEVTPHHFTLTDAALRAASTRVFKVQPAAAHRRRRRPRSSAGSPTAPSTPSPPTTRPHAAGAEGAPVRPGAARDARARDRARRSTLTELVEPGCSPRGRCSALLSWRPAAIAGLAAEPRRAARGRAAPANLCVIDPRRRWDGRRRPRLASRARNTPFAGRELDRPGPPHRCCAASRSSSTARPRDDRDVTARSPSVTSCRPLLVLADGTVFEGEALGAEPPGGVADRRARLQHRRCPATRRSSPTRRYAGQIITFTYPHIGNYGVNAADDESRAPVLPRRRRARPGPPAEQLARRPATSTRSCAATGSPGITGIDTRRLTRHLRDAGAMPGRVRQRAGPTVTTPAGRRAAPSRAPTASTSSPRSPPTEPYTVGRRRRAAQSSPTTSASSARSCATSRGIGHRRGRAGVDARRPRCWPAGPTGSSSRTAPATPPRSRDAADADRRAARRGPGVRHLPRPPDPRPRARRRRPTSSPSATTAATTRCATLATGRGRDHEPEPQLRRRPTAPRRRARSPTSTSTTASSRASRLRDVPGVQRAVPPRGGARAARRRATCSTELRRPDGRPQPKAGR